MSHEDVPFAGAAPYHAQHRPDYAPEVNEYLVERFGVETRTFDQRIE